MSPMPSLISSVFGVLVDEMVKRARMYDLPKADQVPIIDIRLSAQDCPKTEDEKTRLAKLPYRQILGQIGYIVLCSQPHLAYAYKECSRFSNNFGDKHWKALLSLAAYMAEHKEAMRLHIARGGGMRLSAYSDAATMA